jgi:hypothetical protein
MYEWQLAFVLLSFLSLIYGGGFHVNIPWQNHANPWKKLTQLVIFSFSFLFYTKEIIAHFLSLYLLYNFNLSKKKSTLIFFEPKKHTLRIYIYNTYKLYININYKLNNIRYIWWLNKWVKKPYHKDIDSLNFTRNIIWTITNNINLNIF